MSMSGRQGVVKRVAWFVDECGVGDHVFLDSSSKCFLLGRSTMSTTSGGRCWVGREFIIVCLTRVACLNNCGSYDSRAYHKWSECEFYALIKSRPKHPKYATLSHHLPCAKIKWVRYSLQQAEPVDVGVLIWIGTSMNEYLYRYRWFIGVLTCQSSEAHDYHTSISECAKYRQT